ncbi:hypothetical protein IWQ60_006524 [Tieghemiomyces parasiticus]|uniref:Uncharacterized protein n=1 Tax=Tieghemiomyces parasiticus TaxID=78921 RepID=A0A9W8DXI6_9FUNG|nr:hypothetical protein IWQ60_006524 [Tieghemiomyces parasiticus]
MPFINQTIAPKEIMEIAKNLPENGQLCPEKDSEMIKQLLQLVESFARSLIYQKYITDVLDDHGYSPLGNPLPEGALATKDDQPRIEHPGKRAERLTNFQPGHPGADVRTFWERELPQFRSDLARIQASRRDFGWQFSADYCVKMMPIAQLIIWDHLDETIRVTRALRRSPFTLELLKDYEPPVIMDDHEDLIFTLNDPELAMEAAALTQGAGPLSKITLEKMKGQYESNSLVRYSLAHDLPDAFVMVAVQHWAFRRDHKLVVKYLRGIHDLDFADLYAKYKVMAVLMLAENLAIGKWELALDEPSNPALVPAPSSGSAFTQGTRLATVEPFFTDQEMAEAYECAMAYGWGIAGRRLKTYARRATLEQEARVVGENETKPTPEKTKVIYRCTLATHYPIYFDNRSSHYIYYDLPEYGPPRTRLVRSVTATAATSPVPAGTVNRGARRQ